MIRNLRIAVLAAAGFFTLIAQGVCSAQLQAAPGIDDVAGHLDRQDGFIPFYLDNERGRLLLQIDDPDRRFLYLTSLSTGIGASALPLDRGTIRDVHVARFERSGDKLFLVLLNTATLHSVDGDPALRRSVEESFATSRVAAFSIVAADDERLLVDTTDFFLQDNAGVAALLSRSDQGSYRVDPDRSAIDPGRTRAFPDNTEIEATLTLASGSPGPVLATHLPDPRSLTLGVHYSFVALPDAGYEPRRPDPRIGTFMVRGYDYTAHDEYEASLRFVTRHRLVRKNPDAALSDPVKPIVFYMDPAFSPAARSAIEGAASGWSRALESAGFTNAVRVELMPPDMDPMDARFHVIQSVHRTRRGSNTGPSLVDPRTGEIIKSAIRLESQYANASRDIFGGLAPSLCDDACASDLSPPQVTELLASGLEAFSQARMQKLALHEIGHTLGLTHNLAGSAHEEPSVMDLIAPELHIVNGRLSLDNAFPDAPGTYDVQALRYLYSQFAAGNEERDLESIAAETARSGLTYISDSEWGPAGSYPGATPWTNGSDPLLEYPRVMAVRSLLMENFDARVLQDGTPLWRLKERFIPIYFLHRATLQAVVKTIGGLEYSYALDARSSAPANMVSAKRQRQALALVIGMLSPDALAVPESVQVLFVPQPALYAYQRHEFEKERAGAHKVDQLAMARALAAMAVEWLLLPERSARVVAFSARDASMPTLEEIVSELVDATWRRSPDGEHAAVARVVQRVVLDALIDLSMNASATVESRAAAEFGLRRIANMIKIGRSASEATIAHLQLATTDIRLALDRQATEYRRSRAPDLSAFLEDTY